MPRPPSPFRFVGKGAVSACQARGRLSPQRPPKNAPIAPASLKRASFSARVQAPDRADVPHFIEARGASMRTMIAMICAGLLSASAMDPGYNEDKKGDLSDARLCADVDQARTRREENIVIFGRYGTGWYGVVDRALLHLQDPERPLQLSGHHARTSRPRSGRQPVVQSVCQMGQAGHRGFRTAASAEGPAGAGPTTGHRG
jgi:hypothetical protein